jgi:hypothetical protein
MSHFVHSYTECRYSDYRHAECHNTYKTWFNRSKIEYALTASDNLKVMIIFKIRDPIHNTSFSS